MWSSCMTCIRHVVVVQDFSHSIFIRKTQSSKQTLMQCGTLGTRTIMRSIPINWDDIINGQSYGHTISLWDWPIPIKILLNLSILTNYIAKGWNEISLWFPFPLPNPPFYDTFYLQILSFYFCLFEINEIILVINYNNHKGNVIWQNFWIYNFCFLEIIVGSVVTIFIFAWMWHCLV